MTWKVKKPVDLCIEMRVHLSQGEGSGSVSRIIWRKNGEEGKKRFRELGVSGVQQAAPSRSSRHERPANVSACTLSTKG